MLRRRKRKVFCVGRNRTGTTSMAQALRGLGYRVGTQHRFEALMPDWEQRDFRRITAACTRADAFQDVPFSLADTFRAMDLAFPGSRFILTVRSSADEWFDSLVRFHARLIGKGRTPTADDLSSFPYPRQSPGWLWRTHSAAYGVGVETLYDRPTYVRVYDRHNAEVRDYFAARTDDLLLLDVSAPEAMARLCNLLEVPFTGQVMPHENRSR